MEPNKNLAIISKSVLKRIDANKKITNKLELFRYACFKKQYKKIDGIVDIVSHCGEMVRKSNDFYHLANP